MPGVADSRAALARALAANQPGSHEPHCVVILPSYSLGSSLLAHYADRLAGLEHRHLLSLLMLPRVPGCEVVFVTSLRPSREVLDYYLWLVPPEDRAAMAARIRVLEVPDSGPRSVTHKLLDRPDLVAELRRMVGGRLAYVDPWNVTDAETRLAARLGLPVNGTDPSLWPLGFKSAGRRIMRTAGVPIPWGREDLRTVDDVVAAVVEVRERSPGAPGVVVKTDDSGAGDGNRVIRFSPRNAAGDVRAVVEAFEPWFLADIALGAVVEELVAGAAFTSPSVQLEIDPDGGVTVLSTHEQILGGENGQVYIGCELPAHRAYSSRLAAYGEAVGRVLAARGALGRLSIDFAAVECPTGGWEVYGLEINLRKGGTTHPYSALRHLAPGGYDGASGRWLTDDGSPRCYRATDNLLDPGWCGREPGDVIAAVRAAGLEFDRVTGTGVVLHMFCGLAVDGRLGLTAIGRSAEEAQALYDAAARALCIRVGPVAPVPS